MIPIRLDLLCDWLYDWSCDYQILWHYNNNKYNFAKILINWNNLDILNFNNKVLIV